MAKKGSTTRVFQLAKELGVTSKDIITKCQAEGIDAVTNHMSAVSLGLAATIHEWFGDGGESGVATAVETAAHVDVDKARKKAAKKKAAKKIKEPEVEAAPVAVAEPEAAATAPEAPAVAQTPPPAAAPAPPADVPSTPAPITTGGADHDNGQKDTPAAPSETVAPSRAAAASAPKSDGNDNDTTPKGGPGENVPDRPNVITPAGPMLTQPKKTTLSGPRVIRVEAPEVIDRPRPRARRGPGGGPGGPPGVGRGPGGGPGAPPGDAPGTAGAGDRRSNRRNRRRSATSRDETNRTGRQASSGPGSRSGNWREQDLREREERLNRSGGFFKSHRRDKSKKGGSGQRATSAAKSGGSVRIEEPITIKSLSLETGIKANNIIRHIMMNGGQLTNAAAVIDTEVAIEVALEYNVELEVVEHKSAEDEIVESFASREYVDEQKRSPVVTILGHVDHGKTTLLDSIRNAKVAAGEAGGITQATSAFQVPVKVGEGERLITFIDTPGHEAFSEMRARGAKVTDIVVLVVAADDGVMPQTIESIKHAQAAEVPIIVALNKIDKAEATDSNIQRILGQLAEHDLQTSEWGGSIEVVRTAALKDQGITDLLEVIDYQAQLLELTGDFGGASEGSVIEAQMEEGRGSVATVLVQQGKLNKGDVVVVGTAYGRVRDIVNDQGKRIKEALPSMPVTISGLNEVPSSGEKFYIVKNIRAAEAAARERAHQMREKNLATEKVTLDNIFDKLAESGRMDLPLVVKADVHGSVETLRATLAKIANDEVRAVVKHAAVGAVNESDIALAEATGAIIIGFNVTSSGATRRLAESKGIDVRYYDVIYDITDDVTKAVEGLLEPELKLEVLGHADVRDVFRITKVGTVAGCYVTDGVIERNALVRVTRDGIVIEKDRKLEQLKRFKDDAKEVRSGQECGMRIIGYDDVKVGDVLECYKTKEVRRTLDGS